MSPPAPTRRRVIKKVAAHGHHGGAWKIAYADFVTAMMALFMVLWLLASTDQKTREEISNYFRTGILPDAELAMNGGAQYIPSIIEKAPTPPAPTQQTIDETAQSLQDAIARMAENHIDIAEMAGKVRVKVGKPWYDEVEVVLRRALEQRQRTRDLTSTLESAIGLGDVDTQLAAIGSLAELGEVVTLRITQLAGVEVAWLARVDGPPIGQPQRATTGRWRLDESIDRDGAIRIGAVGTGAMARDMAEQWIHAAKRRAGAIVVSAHAPGVPRSRIDELMRQATIGTLTGTLLHDVASMLQGIDGAIAAVAEAVSADPSSELAEAARDIATTARDAFELFVATRKFLSEGVVKPRRVTVDQLVKRVVRHCASAMRQRVQLRAVGSLEVVVELADTLFVRSVADLIGAAVALAPNDAQLELRVEVEDARVRFAIFHDGPGVPAALAPGLFEPLTWNRPSELPIRLAIAAYTLRGLGAEVVYHRDVPSGSTFVVEVPRAPAT